jgi:hypothetical protein
MDVTDIANTATAMSQQKLGNDVQISVLKKAMDIDAQSAAALIAAIPQPPSNPPHMGNSVYTYA